MHVKTIEAENLPVEVVWKYPHRRRPVVNVCSHYAAPDKELFASKPGDFRYERGIKTSSTFSPEEDSTRITLLNLVSSLKKERPHPCDTHDECLKLHNNWKIGSRIGRNRTTVMRICDLWLQHSTTDRRDRSHPPQCTTLREDSKLCA
ncbi:hypothetical protein TNCV_4832241 [Trichonephila clavipes]|nr:hypothetical protein TNCV_4832241 [Trichonephila clavipes]